MTGVYATEVSDASGTGLFDVEHRPGRPSCSARSTSTRRLLPDGGRVDRADRDALPTTSARPGACPRHAGVRRRRRRRDPDHGDGHDRGGLGRLHASAPPASSRAGCSRCPDNPDGRVQVSAGNEPGRWHIMGVSLSAGGAFQWLRDALTPLNDSQQVTFERLISLAKGVEPGAGGLLFLPYLLGERSPYVAPDASASLVGLSQMHKVGHISRAVLEGVLHEPPGDPRGLRRGGPPDRPDHRVRRRDQGAAVAAAAGRRARARGRDRHRRVRGRRVRGGAGGGRRRRGLAGPLGGARPGAGRADLHARPRVAAALRRGVRGAPPAARGAHRRLRAGGERRASEPPSAASCSTSTGRWSTRSPTSRTP